MGEEIFLPYGAVYYLGKALYKTVKRGFHNMKERNIVREDLKKILTTEYLEETAQKIRKELPTVELKEIDGVISLALKLKVFAKETPKQRMLEEIHHNIILMLYSRDETVREELGINYKEL